MEVMEQRRSEIVAFVNEKGSITFAQLKERFPSVSEMTLRTDLKILDQSKRLVRIHGGAKSLEQITGNDDLLRKRFIQNTEAKKEIAEKAVPLVEPHKTIFLDSGSTTTMLTHRLQNQPNVIITSGLTCAIELAQYDKIKGSLGGGNLNTRSLSINGSEGIRYLEKINFDIAFIGVTRYSKETGFTCESFEDALIKRTVIERAEKVILLMDSSKINKRGTYTICSETDVDAVVCDKELPQIMKEEWENLGLSVY